MDRLCDYRRADINGNRLTPGPERGQHQAARALIKRRKKKKEGERQAWPRREKVDVILPDHHAGPASYQTGDLSSPLNFPQLMKRTEKKKKRKKNTHKMGWNETVILWLLKSGSRYNNLFKDHQMHKGPKRKVQREGGEDTGGLIQIPEKLRRHTPKLCIRRDKSSNKEEFIDGKRCIISVQGVVFIEQCRTN